MDLKKIVNSQKIDDFISNMSQRAGNNINKISAEIDTHAPRFAAKVTDKQRKNAKHKNEACSFCGELGSEVYFKKIYPYHKKCLRFIIKQSILNSPKVLKK